MHEPQITPEAYADQLQEVFLSKGDPFRAERQRAYLRNQFECCGLSAPEWLAILKEKFEEQGTFTGKKLEQFIRHCYASEYREMHYSALEMMQRRLKEQPESWIMVLEKCIRTQSWWDTVDWLGKLTGMHFKRFPNLQHAYANKWIASDHMWLQRVAIIHQLFYREKTDVNLLFAMITEVAESKEFFLQKACGWALRQHAKTDPAIVRKFIRKQPLSALTLREVNRQLDKM